MIHSLCTISPLCWSAQTEVLWNKNSVWIVISRTWNIPDYCPDYFEDWHFAIPTRRQCALFKCQSTFLEQYNLLYTAQLFLSAMHHVLQSFPTLLGNFLSVFNFDCDIAARRTNNTLFFLFTKWMQRCDWPWTTKLSFRPPAI